MPYGPTGERISELEYQRGTLKGEFVELQSLIEIRNQLERIPKCELRDALAEKVERKLNPSLHSNKAIVKPSVDIEQKEITDPDPSPRAIERDSYSYSDWKPKQPRNWFVWLILGLIILGCLRLGWSYVSTTPPDSGTNVPAIRK